MIEAKVKFQKKFKFHQVLGKVFKTYRVELEVQDGKILAFRKSFKAMIQAFSSERSNFNLI